MPTLGRDQNVDVHFSIEFVLLYRQKHPILVGLLRNVSAVGSCCEISFINWLPIKRRIWKTAGDVIKNPLNNHSYIKVNQAISQI